MQELDEELCSWPDGTADFSFPLKVCEELLRAGKASPHRIFPESDTAVSYKVFREPDLLGVLDLFERSCELKKNASVRR